MSYLLAAVFTLLVSAGIIIANERFGLLRCDDFASRAAKIFAYLWLTFFLVLLGLVTMISAAHPPSPQQLAKIPFLQLFLPHFAFIIFLLGWWLATGRPALRTFLNIPRERTGEAVLAGFALGIAGWLFTIFMLLAVVAILKAANLFPDGMQPSPMIGFFAQLPWWKKLFIVVSAMTIEEALFRGFFQKRIGLIASTILFALAHYSYGQPMLLVGVTMISLVIGAAFYRTKNLIPGVIAHGVFDAVQIFVIIPVALKLAGI